MAKVIIGVMGPGDRATPTDLQNAYKLGEKIAQAGWVVLSGGRNLGVMDAVSRGAKNKGGLTIGILPNPTAGVSSALDIAIITDLGNARNNINVLSSQVVVACGMGAGTASEVALAIKAQKPVILLTENRLTQAFFQEIGGDRVFLAPTVDAVITQINVMLETQ